VVIVLQSAANQPHNPQSNANMNADSPLGLHKLIHADPPCILLQAIPLLSQPGLQSLIARDDQGPGLQIEAVAPLRVVAAPDDADARLGLPVHTHPEPLGVVGPAAGLADGAALPLLEHDVVVVAG